MSRYVQLTSQNFSSAKSSEAEGQTVDGPPVLLRVEQPAHLPWLYFAGSLVNELTPVLAAVETDGFYDET